MILSDLQKDYKIYLGWLLMILTDLWKGLKFIWSESQWFAMILNDLQKTEIYLGWFLMIFNDLWKTLKFIWGNSQWFSVIHEKLKFIWMILNES